MQFQNSHFAGLQGLSTARTRLVEAKLLNG